MKKKNQHRQQQQQCSEDAAIEDIDGKEMINIVRTE